MVLLRKGGGGREWIKICCFNGPRRLVQMCPLHKVRDAKATLVSIFSEAIKTIINTNLSNLSKVDVFFRG